MIVKQWKVIVLSAVAESLNDFRLFIGFETLFSNKFNVHVDLTHVCYLMWLEEKLLITFHLEKKLES